VTRSGRCWSRSCPRGKKPGRPPEHAKRQLINGIRWRTRTGAPWRDVPPAYGPWQTERDLAGDPDRPAGPGRCGRADHLDVPVDSTVARAHQHAAGARKRGDLQAEPPGGVQDEPADHGLGRSRGGLTTKVHLACEQRQKPLSVVITAGQRGDSPQFQPVLEAIAVPRSGPGRARTRPDRVLADKAYGSRANRAYLRRRGIRCTSAWTRHPRRRGPRGTRSSGPAGLMRHLTNGRVTAMCHPRTVAAQLADLACL